MEVRGRTALLVLLAVAAVLLYRTVAPFLMPMLLAAVLSVLAHPLTDRLRLGMGGMRRAAAMLTTVLVFLGLVLPIAVLAMLVLYEAAYLLPVLAPMAERFDPRALVERQGWIPEVWRGRLSATLPSAGEALAQAGETLSLHAAAVLARVASATTDLLLKGFLFFVATYYFLADGQALLKRAVRLLPIDERHDRELFREFKDTCTAVIGGTVVFGLIQGVLVYAALAVASVPSAALLAALVVVLAILPLVGAGLVWAPAGILLLWSGRLWEGAFVLLWGALVVGTVENVLRPLVIKSRLHVHPLLVFLSLFGGLAAFGAMGLLIGPLLASTFTTLLRIWERETTREPTPKVRREDPITPAIPRPTVSAEARAPGSGSA